MKTILEFIVKTKLHKNSNILVDFIYNLYNTYYTKYKHTKFKGFTDKSFDNVTERQYEINDEYYSTTNEDFKDLYMELAVDLQKNKSVTYFNKLKTIDKYTYNDDILTIYLNNTYNAITMITVTKNIKNALIE